jgi:glycosyltransferase involved in cell wall biosynthesis
MLNADGERSHLAVAEAKYQVEGYPSRYRIAFIGGRGVKGRYSGVETFYEEVGSRLVARGHEVTAYCRPHFTPACETYRGIRVRRIPTLRSKHLETLIHSCLSTVDAAARRFDIVHFHAIGSSIFALLPRLAGCRTVVTVHGLDWQRAKWKVFARGCLRTAEWAGMAFPDRTTAVSQSVASALEVKYGSPITAIPNGVNVNPRAIPDRILPLGLDAGRYLLFVGRLSEEKGCHQLIQAFTRLSSGRYQLVFAGGATYATEYETQVRQAAEGDVRFLGFVDQDILAELYSNCALFVLPSRLEGLSVALLEAMSYAAPVMVSDIPENTDVVGDAGYSFRAGDVDDLTAQLTRALADPAALRETGLRARARVMDNYSWDSTVGSLERIYDLLVRE